ncbi:unnamed protein product, partial [Mesorhabditis belari]|uniref:DUS-like FMN-binding domain-containing protein n=1 Tax=Mesorhabditis belari TaxID=2138241 RepID=A0AAF3F408_9BILA
MPAPRDENFYKNRYIVAPMVRAGRTPLRLLCLEYGADLVYTEELVDQKLLSCKRIENEILDTIDYVNADEVVLRIATKREADRIVLQIGTSSGQGAAAVARMVGRDVAAIDVNMGCPKPFSIAGGMGAALLTRPDKIKEILTALVEASQVPVTAKIRLRNDPKDTLALVELIESCGVSAIGVHGRRRDERNPDRCREEEIAEVVKYAKVPIIANGGSGSILTFDDIEKFRQQTTASSVMIARKALCTPSIFWQRR